MILVVHVPEWVMDEDRRVVAVGDPFLSWLTMDEAERDFVPSQSVSRVKGQARLLPDWPGAEDQRFPVQVDLGAAALYWDAPAPIEGPIDMCGVIRHNNVDAPDGFPETRGVVRRVRMEWRTFDGDGQGEFEVTNEPAHYEDVDSSSLPGWPDSLPGWPDMNGTETMATLWTGLLVDIDITE